MRTRSENDKIQTFWAESLLLWAASGFWGGVWGGAAGKPPPPIWNSAPPPSQTTLRRSPFGDGASGDALVVKLKVKTRVRRRLPLSRIRSDLLGPVGSFSLFGVSMLKGKNSSI
jgi:hypothetical protein